MSTLMEIPEIQVVSPQPAVMPQVSLNSIMQTANETMQTTDLDKIEATTTTQTENSKEMFSFENSSFIMEEDAKSGELPPLTYVDFMPRCLGRVMEESEPQFADFKSVMDQTNQWLESMPQYAVFRCETITKKLQRGDYKLDNDAVMSHHSSNGDNTFIRGVRLWLMPRDDPTSPTQKLSYMTVLPDHEDPKVYGKMNGLISSATFRMTVNRVMSQFDSLPTSVEKLNRHLMTRPIPGKLLSVEVLSQMISQSLKASSPNTEVTCWSECGKNNRLYVNALRVFYVVGESAFESIGMHDTVPDIVQNSDGFAVKVKFAPFNTVVSQASRWLKDQEGLRVISIQSPYVKCDRLGNGAVSVSSGQAGYVELTNCDSQFVRIMRVFYTKDKKVSSDPLTLSSRLFVPVRKFDTGRDFEGFSNTIQRVINWLNLTKSPVLSVETVQYQIHPDSWGSGVQENKVDMVNSHSNGRYYLTCVRLYFPVMFSEPPPEMLKTTDEEEVGWGCVVQ
ncbi:uncharacterized protein LOC121384311 [Gigantopelta aegis]|uniref:uncharacterized protein LOC121384311 n=1 Tax=Gigantopelta aegis TaxID=1735272 RepID=UPI001B88C682|nr:uncharacterized protein LOC121384311 [Gigantopelta aegis]